MSTVLAVTNDKHEDTSQLQFLADMIIASARAGQLSPAKFRPSPVFSQHPQELLNHLRQTVAPPEAKAEQPEPIVEPPNSVMEPEKSPALTAQYILDQYFWSPPEVECPPSQLAALVAEPDSNSQQQPCLSDEEISIALSDETPADVIQPLPDYMTPPLQISTSIVEVVPDRIAPPGKACEQYRYDEQKHAPKRPHLPGQFVKFGPYELRPACGYELAFGRDYQSIPYNSVSRLAGFVGLDEYSLYIREVPNEPTWGLRPSRNGIWVRQPHEEIYRRLKPGEAERISPETEIRVGGNGTSPETGLQVSVLA